MADPGRIRHSHFTPEGNDLVSSGIVIATH
jgi:hypothetical protein